jgi:DNA modification methylase
MKIQEVKISDVKANPNNPRIIKDEKFRKLVESIKSFPEMLKLRPIVVNHDMIVLGGNMRLKACKEAGLKMVPIIRAEDLTEDQQREFIIKDNVGFGDWDWEELANNWEAEKLEEWGLDVPDFKVEPEAEEDDYEVPETITTDIVPGDLFEIGAHRLLCGDSTDADAVARLMNGEKADCCLTDPPYGLGEKKKSGKNDYSVFEDTLENVKSMALLWLPIAQSISKFVVFSPGVTRQWIYPEPNWVMCWFYGGGQLRSSWGFNCWQPFLCYGKDPSLAQGKGARPDAVDMNTPSNSGDIDHPCPKPIKLWEWLFNRLSFNVGDLFYEPFSGSGTTHIVAHQLNRKCYGMELDPKYCQVIVDRMRKLDPALVIKRNGEVI